MSINYGCNDNEAIVLAAFEKRPVLTLGDLAKHCPSGSGSGDTTSWARNSIRKPTKHGLIAKVGRGRHEVTPKLATFCGGQVLAEARKQALMSQVQVAEIIGASGRNRVSDIERGAKRPSLTELYALMGAVKVKIVDLFPIVEALKADETADETPQADEKAA